MAEASRIRRLALSQPSACLFDFLIELWRVELGQELPRLHGVAQIHQPATHVAVGARVDVGLLQALERRRQ